MLSVVLFLCLLLVRGSNVKRGRSERHGLLGVLRPTASHFMCLFVYTQCTHPHVVAVILSHISAGEYSILIGSAALLILSRGVYINLLVVFRFRFCSNCLLTRSFLQDVVRDLKPIALFMLQNGLRV